MINNKEKIEKAIKNHIQKRNISFAIFEDIGKGFIAGIKYQKKEISKSVEQTIKDICKDNTHLLDTPEIQEIIKYFKQ